MDPRIDYLEFAIRHFSGVEYDLASSGAPAVQVSELGYEAADDPEARQRFLWAIAGRYQVPLESIVPALGASGALYTVCKALVGPGMGVAVEAPAYEPLWRVPEGLGAQVSRFDRSASVQQMLAQIDPGAKLVVLSNPHNPTAHVLEDDALLELATALGPDRYLLVDEVYRELARPVTTCFREAKNLVVINSVTKCLGVPWARAGWIYAPSELIPSLRRVELHTVGNAPPGCFAWGAAAVEQAGWLLERVARLQRGKRELLDAWLKDRAEHLEVGPAFDGSLFLWVRDRRGGDLLPGIEAGISDHGVVVSPGGFFGAADCFRVSFTLSEERLVAGLQRLDGALGLGGGTVD